MELSTMFHGWGRSIFFYQGDNMLTIRSVASIFAVAVMALDAGLVASQDYPSKPIRISTVQTGGATDFLARLIANGITGPLGQPVIVENRPTLVAIQTGIKAPPDGYTIIVSGGTMWYGILLQSKPLWDPVNDFSPITIAVSAPDVIVVHPSLPVKSVKDLIALAKARPGELNYGLGSPGGATQFAAELFKSKAGVNIVAIPYKGSGPAMNGLLGGEVQVGFENTISTTSHIKSGRLRAVAVTSLKPSALVPGVPTVTASGLPGYESGSQQGVVAPAKTPASIVRRLNQEIVRVLNMPDVKQKLFDNGAETVGSSPEEFAAKIKYDLEWRGKVIKDAGIKPVD